ncbi:Nif3-like dinuclear metal center hexameric protein [Irregularibacter muris]|uniref:GTP cyclohydrolase 1 type 2 homolog n=1 Tax=Irregularibacter muris TaxID=1796619 RepID=A0AAE3HEA6_9FIRM|nr:Nif3-like dinuclear metal center hexameric protein [Irregularibacter muris]MCR1897879.1 Nif3-like dinuclear metal center hexameric protein [Irregularibacter muris]
MAVKCQTIIEVMEQLAPKSLAEQWDNVGLQIGHPRADIQKVLVSLDLTEEVIQEAIAHGANMIITHHPFIFQPLKHIRWDLPTGRLIKELIQHEIVLYAAHTNLDIAQQGLNDMLAQKLSLQNIEILSQTGQEKLYKIVVFVPKGHEEQIRDVLSNKGAGWIGNYSHCTFQTPGTGTFKPLEGTNPFIGNIGKIEYTQEYRLETIVPQSDLSKVIKAMIKAHPYEEVAYDIYPLENQGKVFGIGRIGNLQQPISYEDFLQSIKNILNINRLRLSGPIPSSIKRVALCTGSGAQFMHQAARQGGDVYITGDVKYHEAQQAKDLGICLIDAGHFATEVIVIEGLKNYLDAAFIRDKRDVQVISSKVNKDFFEWK